MECRYGLQVELDDVYQYTYSPCSPMMDVDARVNIYTAMALGRGRVASPTLAAFTPGKSPRYSFYSWLSGPRASLDTKE